MSLQRHAQRNTDTIPLPRADGETGAVSRSGVQVGETADVVDADEFEDVFNAYRHFHIGHIGVLAVAEVSSNRNGVRVHRIGIGEFVQAVSFQWVVTVAEIPSQYVERCYFPQFQ